MKLDCPSCGGCVEVQPSCANSVDGCYMNFGTLCCPTCGKELVLYATKVDEQTIDYRLVDPALRWTFEEIMNREG
jgi:hypothetical protein